MFFSFFFKEFIGRLISGRLSFRKISFLEDLDYVWTCLHELCSLEHELVCLLDNYYVCLICLESLDFVHEICSAAPCSISSNRIYSWMHAVDTFYNGHSYLCIHAPVMGCDGLWWRKFTLIVFTVSTSYSHISFAFCSFYDR